MTYSRLVCVAAVIVCGGLIAAQMVVGVGGEQEAVTTVAAANEAPPAEVPSAVERIDAALAMKVDIAFKNATLGDAAAWIRKQGEIDVVVDRRAMVEAGIDPDAVRLSLTLRQVSLHAALWHLLRPHEFVTAATDDALVLTTRDKAPTMLVTRTHDVGDLIHWRDETGGDQRDTDWLAEVIYAAGPPLAWNQVGGPGAYMFFDDAMAVSTDWETQRRIASVLATLREAIKRQAAGDYSRVPIPQLSDGDERVLKALHRNVEIDIDQMSLAGLVKLVRELSGVNAIVDEKSLASAGLDAEGVKFSGTRKNATLSKSLRAILHETDMDFVATHEVLLFVTRDSGDEWLSSMLYPVADFGVAWEPNTGEDLTHVEELIAMITSIVAPTSWPEGTGPGPVKYLAPWDLLLIPQTDDCHRQIESLLAGIRRVRAEQRGTDRGNAKPDPLELRVYRVASAPNDIGTASWPAAKEVAEAVRDLVEPQSWSDEGVYLRALGDRIVVRHRRSVQRQVRRFISVLPPQESP
jgi:hypothetical protein